jgi:hypothetical protein
MDNGRLQRYQLMILKHPVDGSKLLENNYKQNGYLTTDETIDWLGKRISILCYQCIDERMSREKR